VCCVAWRERERLPSRLARERKLNSTRCSLSLASPRHFRVAFTFYLSRALGESSVPRRTGRLRRPVRRPTSGPASALQRVLRAEAFFFRGNVQDAVRRGRGQCTRACASVCALQLSAHSDFVIFRLSLLKHMCTCVVLSLSLYIHMCACAVLSLSVSLAHSLRQGSHPASCKTNNSSNKTNNNNKPSRPKQQEKQILIFM
jgi:hypothetical protein